MMVVLPAISACPHQETYMAVEHPDRFMKSGIVCVLIILLSFGSFGVQAGLQDVPPGETVFIGEEQLDISASGIGAGSQIAWWAPGTSVEDVPADVVTISNPSSFSALSSSFSGREGIWYSLSDKTPVLKIKDPRVHLRVYDTSHGFEATDKWIPRGDLVSFQIETNLHEIGNRGDGAGAPFDIIIRSPTGSEYSAVSGPSGSFSLTGIPIRSSSYDSGPVWYTGDADIGTYEVRAECTANRINDNNADPGAAVSQAVSVLIQGTNPLISGRPDGTESDENKPAATVMTTNAPPPLPSPVQTALPTVTLVPDQGLVQNMTNQTPTPSPSPDLQTVEPPVLPAASPSNIPMTPAQTSLSGLLAILACVCLLVRISR